MNLRRRGPHGFGCKCPFPNLKPPMNIPLPKTKAQEAEERLDELFTIAFETNDPTMIDWVTIKFQLKKIEGLEIQNKNLIKAMSEANIGKLWSKPL